MASTAASPPSALCRVSNDVLRPVLSLGAQPLGNGFLPKSSFATEQWFDLVVGFSEASKMVQLVEQPDPSAMFHETYAFQTRSSRRMTEHFGLLADRLGREIREESADPYVVELGCNDGVFLEPFSQQGVRHTGVEPARNVAELARRSGVSVLEEFFSSRVASELLDQNGPADLIYAANVMCHIPAILDVAKGIRTLVRETGLLVFEDPYLGDVVEKNSFDQFYDEHVFMFSLHSVKHLFEQVRMSLVHVEHLDVHGGSMRYFLTPDQGRSEDDSVRKWLAWEEKNGIADGSGLAPWSKRVEQNAAELRRTLVGLKNQKKKVVGYAATSKSTTVLNYANIGPEIIDFIVDSTQEKQGLFSPGKHIPIVAPEMFMASQPDVAVLFAWNHLAEITSAEKGFRALGGRWLTHVPKVGVLD